MQSASKKVTDAARQPQSDIKDVGLAARAVEQPARTIKKRLVGLNNTMKSNITVFNFLVSIVTIANEMSDKFLTLLQYKIKQRGEELARVDALATSINTNLHAIDEVSKVTAREVRAVKRIFAEICQLLKEADEMMSQTPAVTEERKKKAIYKRIAKFSFFNQMQRAEEDPNMNSPDVFEQLDLVETLATTSVEKLKKFVMMYPFAQTVNVETIPIGDSLRTSQLELHQSQTKEVPFKVFTKRTNPVPANEKPIEESPLIDKTENAAQADALDISDPLPASRQPDQAPKISLDNSRSLTPISKLNVDVGKESEKGIKKLLERFELEKASVDPQPPVSESKEQPVQPQLNALLSNEAVAPKTNPAEGDLLSPVKHTDSDEVKSSKSSHPVKSASDAKKQSLITELKDQVAEGANAIGPVLSPESKTSEPKFDSAKLDEGMIETKTRQSKLQNVAKQDGKPLEDTPVNVFKMSKVSPFALEIEIPSNTDTPVFSRRLESHNDAGSASDQPSVPLSSRSISRYRLDDYQPNRVLTPVSVRLHDARRLNLALFAPYSKDLVKKPE